ncbi:FAD/NAD(P)-binding domain-containing protein [Thozetella sp. PMI_491]|nr:FAD/NAD(P)-binding domain-containing protein [Thozetella sp. PMI_491]
MTRVIESRPKKLRCTIIGAGVSGLLFAYKLRKHLSEHISVAIYEKNPDLGGTWYENKYPGCACDVPSHVYQFPFAPNPEWSKFYAPSQEIQEYLKRVARYFDLERTITYNCKVVHARWSEDSHSWTVKLENGTKAESEILVNAGGILNDPQLPSIHGYSSFAGPRLHTASWDSSVDLDKKRVAIIGAGASAIQLLPKIQPLASHIDIYIRTPSWITPPVAAPTPEARDHVYSSEERESFRWNERLYLRKRKEMEDQFNGSFKKFFKGSSGQREFRNQLEARMRTLIPDENLQSKLIPSFEVGCRRINPGEPYLVALQEANVEPIFEPIERITPGGVVVAGVEHAADILITATGFNTSFKPRFPIIGRNSINLQDKWSQDPVSYMGTGVAGFPNYLVFLGPNTPISNGGLIGVLEATSDYFIRLLRKVVRQNVACFDVREDAQTDFDIHTREFMQGMVWTGTCRSWFKQGPNGKVTALWPGSSLHYMQTLAENRWEDYRWVYRGERFSYWGSGVSWVEDASIDPLGLEERESLEKTTTIPKKGSDLSFYLWESTPLPRRETTELEKIVAAPV